ncbi:MAG: type II toxin-antitoxin system HicB family antitoxin [Actinomycetia bacterium]|nr:type II toxin-antitoxin system HicB family antitoxin [Actinomycetes bacterium]
MLLLSKVFLAAYPELFFLNKKTAIIASPRTNLIEALELFFEYASPQEINERLHNEIFITRLQVYVG